MSECFDLKLTNLLRYSVENVTNNTSTYILNVGLTNNQVFVKKEVLLILYSLIEVGRTTKDSSRKGIPSTDVNRGQEQNRRYTVVVRLAGGGAESRHAVSVSICEVGDSA